MNLLKKLFSNFPEYYLILLVFLTGYAPPFYVAPVNLVVIGLLILQAVYKNKATGMAIASVFFIGNLYFFMALIEEHKEFKAGDPAGGKFLLVGLSLIVLNVTVAIKMLMNYARQENEPVKTWEEPRRLAG